MYLAFLKVMVITASDSCIKSESMLYMVFYIIPYYICYIFLYAAYYIHTCNWFRIACAHYVMHIKWQLLCGVAIKLWGLQFKESSPKSTHTQTHIRRHIDTHIHTEVAATSSRRNVRCKCGIMPKKSVRQQATVIVRERGEAESGGV